MTAIAEAVVLAAGEGRHLRPLTTYQPKPMLPVANRPIIEYVLDALVENDIEHAIVVVGHGNDRIQTCLGDTYREMELSYVRQSIQLGSGHALQQVEGHVAEEFLVVNGDTIVDSDIVGQTIERYAATTPAATIAVAHSDTPEEYGVVVYDDGVIADIDEHAVETKGYLVNAGVYVFSTSVFEALERTDSRLGGLHLTDVVGHLDGPVTSVLVNGGWLDPATPWRLLSVTETVLAREADVVVAPSANVHESVRIEGPAIVGPGCELDAGVIVRGGSCLQANVQVGPGTILDRSIVFTDARIGGSVHLCDSVVGTGCEIGVGTVSPGGRADVTIDGTLFVDRRVGSVVADRAVVGPNATLLPGSSVGTHAHVGAGVVVSGAVTEGMEVMC
jgi:NDP-sugar pyrophosphorylase family protein